LRELLKRVEINTGLENQIYLFSYYYYFKIFDVKDFKSRDFETLLVF